MPDPAPNPMDPAAVEQHNAEIIAKQAAQDAAGRSAALKPGEFEDAATALDKIFLQPDPPAKKDDALPGVVEPKDPAAEAAAKKAEEDKAAAEAAAAKAAEEAKKADDFFKDSPTLPPGASPKSAEAFATIKVRAAKEIQERDAKLEAMKTELEELKKRASTPTTEQLQQQKELQEMREWRAKLDVDIDPQFKEFDKKINEGHEFVYAQLRKSPVITDAVIEQIKKFGGPENSILTKLFEQVNDPVLQRIVESKIADLTMVRYQKDQAIAAAKANITEYLNERQKFYQSASVNHTTQTQAELGRLLDAADFMKERPVEGDAAAKKAAESYNASLARVRGEVAEALKDDSPQMRATLLTAYAKMCYLQEENAAIKAELEGTKKSLSEVSAKYEGVKKASTSRLRESNAPTAGIPKTPAPPSVATRTEDALDGIMKQVMEARAAAATK